MIAVHSPCTAGERVVFLDDFGFERRVPSRYTDLVEADPLLLLWAGRSAFRIADLLALSDLLSGLEAGE